MEISNYLVSWVVTYLGDLQPTYIGVIIYLLSSMDILVSWIRFCSLRGDSAPNQPKPTEKAVSLFRILKGTTMTTNLLAMVMKITLQVHGMIRTRESSFLGVSVSSFFPVRISERRFRNRNPEDSVSNRRSQSPRWRTHGGTDDGNPGSQKIRMVFAWWFKPWPFWDGEKTWPFQGVKTWPPTIGDEVWALWITWWMVFSEKTPWFWSRVLLTINNSRVDVTYFFKGRNLDFQGKDAEKKRGVSDRSGESKSLNRFCRKGSFGDSSPDKTPRKIAR